MHHSQDDIEQRMNLLSAKVDRVTSQTCRMINRSSNLNSNSQVLMDQVAALQYDLKNINKNLK